ncbi:MAG: diguanylate cyclase domain-containing protein [Thermodesulfobacteriota bacterium]
MQILTNIRAKVWSCVAVALLGYLLATIATSISNIRITDSLTRLQEIHFPLALKGERIFTLFNEQTKNFEGGLITGDADELTKAREHHEEISSLLHQMVETASSQDMNFYPQLLTLRDAYEDYFALAADQYLQMSRGADLFEHTHQLLRIGKARELLLAKFTEITGQLTATVVSEINNNKQRAAGNSRLLQLLFIAVLLVVTLVINLLANRELILPLQNLKELIDNFARGKMVEKPQVCDSADEICSLALSFWDMTEELKKISVSRNYLDNIINYMSDCLLVLSPTLAVTRINQSTLNLLSYQEEELLNQPANRIFTEYGTGATLQTIFEELLQGKSITNLEMMLRTRDNNQIPVLFSGTTFYNTSGTVEGVICLARDIRELKGGLDTRESIANFDPLTRLPNDNLFHDRLSHAMGLAKRSQKLLALLLIDLDLSSIVPAPGEDADKLMLQEAAKRFLYSVRETDTVARMRDQFAIILTNLNEQQDARLVISKIIQEFCRPFPMADSDEINLSIGIALFPADGRDAATLLRNAGAALDEARIHGGSFYSFYGSSTSLPANHRI